MRNFILSAACLGLIGASSIQSSEASQSVNCESSVWRDKEICKQDEDSGRIKTDVNIKRNKKRFVFNELFPAAEKPSSQIFYDREYQRTGCNLLGKCLRTVGIIAKWSNYFVEIQPYEETRPRVGFQKSQVFPSPPKSIWIKLSDNLTEIQMTNRDKNQYYLPLKLRKEIQKNSTDLSIEMSGGGIALYNVGELARPLLNSIVNTTNELKEYVGQSSGGKSKADRLNELEELFNQGLINQTEYKEGRKKIIND